MEYKIDSLMRKANIKKGDIYLINVYLLYCNKKNIAIKFEKIIFFN